MNRDYILGYNLPHVQRNPDSKEAKALWDIASDRHQIHKARLDSSLKYCKYYCDSYDDIEKFIVGSSINFVEFYSVLLSDTYNWKINSADKFNRIIDMASTYCDIMDFSSFKLELIELGAIPYSASSIVTTNTILSCRVFFAIRLIILLAIFLSGSYMLYFRYISSIIIYLGICLYHKDEILHQINIIIIFLQSI